jgi:hypothetical protein
MILWSIKKSRIDSHLRPKLISIFCGIVVVDVTGASFIWFDGYQYTILAVVAGLMHTLVSFHLLLLIQGFIAYLLT